MGSIEGYSAKDPDGGRGDGEAIFLVIFMLGLILMAVLCYWRGYAYEQRRKLQEELEGNAQKDLMECDEEDQEKSADKIGEDLSDDKVEAAKEKMKDLDKI